MKYLCSYHQLVAWNGTNKAKCNFNRFTNTIQNREGYYEGRVLVVDALLPSDFDLVDFIDDMRSERIQELMP